MKDFLKRILGIERLEKERIEALARAAEAIAKEQAAKEAERIAKQTPKERATEAKEPWVAVLDTHINKENIRNGFFELDWNEYFVLQLRSAGYKGESDEDIVNQWFTELCRNVADEEGIDMSRRGTGYINVNNIGNGRSEVS